MSKELEIGVKPILDTKILKKQLELNTPKLKIDIDPGYLAGQIQGAVKKVQISPVNIPVNLKISEETLRTALNASITALSQSAAMPEIRMQMPKTTLIPGIPSQVAANPAKTTDEHGFMSGIVNTGTEAIRTYSSLSGIIGTMVGLMDGTAVGNFSKSFD